MQFNIYIFSRNSYLADEKNKDMMQVEEKY